MPLDHYFTLEDRDAFWPAIRAIRAEHPELFNLYSEDVLASAVVDDLVGREEAPDLGELVAALEQRAQSAGPWLISTPMANIALPAPVVALGEDALLHRVVVARSNEEMGAADAEEANEIDVETHRLIGRGPLGTSRWLRERGERPATDTRRMAALMSVEEGTVSLAAARAKSRAAYALAAWSTLKPPGEREVLPDLGTWVPQPFVSITQRYRERPTDAEEEGRRRRARPHTRGGTIHEWAPYEAPDAAALRLPFQALAVAEERRSAQALLTASLALFQASRGSRFTLSERIRDIQVAIETLCEEDAGARHDPVRWDRVLERHGAVERLARVYSEEEIADAQRRLRTARHVATHGADAVLVGLAHHRRNANSSTDAFRDTSWVLPASPLT